MNKAQNGHAVIIDPFSSGRFLAGEFRERGIPAIAVLTGGIPAPFASGFEPTQYAAVIDYDGDANGLAARLRAFDPVCVMAGVETGIALMDRLSEAFGLPGNDPRGSEMRRDKYLMQETLRQAGLNAVMQCRASDVATAAAWLDQHGRYPVVVKPAQSAGSDNINFCATKDEALAAVTRVLEASNLFGVRNASALVQEYLDGQEWVVDTVSCAGECMAVNVTRYKKIRSRDDKLVYRHSAFLPPDQDQHAELIDYAKRVAAALHIEYGAAHIEIIASSRGPVLVEVNTRMHGGDAVVVLRDYARFTQLELAVDSFIDPAAFRRKSAEDVPYRAYVVAHFLISELAGKVKRVIDRQALAQLRSFAGEHLPAIGDSIRVTDSLTSAPGLIWLANPSQALLEADQARLVESEARGELYSV